MTTKEGEPSPAKRDEQKTRRLLPMELRKRRRAAKLQVAAQKKSRVSLAPSPPHQIPVQSVSKPATPQEVEEEANQVLDSTAAIEEDKDKNAAGSSLLTKKNTSPSTQNSSAARLSSLYTTSLQSQRRRIIPGANVPKTFHVADLPLDVVPKAKLSILTAYPYPFQRTNSQIKNQALKSFISGDRSETSANQSTSVRWQRALHYFVHPADSVPTSMLHNRATAAASAESLLGGTKGDRKREEKAFFTARWNTWQEAFRDAYLNFRRQASVTTGTETPDDSFYLRSSEFVVCFVSDTYSQEAKEEDFTSIINLCHKYDEATEENEEETKRARKRRLCAVMSQSNARIRKVLHHLNVEYTMPYINSNETQREVGEFHLLEEELQETRSRIKDKHSGGLIAPVTRTGSTQENMHGTESLLLFHGHDAVHGLYEFLINRPPMSNQDVPELYALHPFTNASIQSLQVTSFGRVGGSVTESLSEDQTSRPAVLFRTEILGFCFPLSVAKLLDVLKDEWEAAKSSDVTDVSSTGKQETQIALRSYMETVAGAERLNAVKMDAQLVTISNEKQVDSKERHKRLQELEFSKRRMETVVMTTMESRYEVETTTQTIVARR